MGAGFQNYPKQQWHAFQALWTTLRLSATHCNFTRKTFFCIGLGLFNCLHYHIQIYLNMQLASPDTSFIRR